MKIKKLWTMPDHLGEHGQAFYKRIGRELVKNRHLEGADYALFVSLCDQYDLAQLALLELHRDGISVSGGREVPKKHPAFTVYKALMENFIKLCAHFGLSPKSRGDKFVIIEKPTKEELKVERFFRPKAVG